MKFYGKAEEVGKRILESFEQGNVPEALAQVFIRRHDNIPCRSWSFSNQLVTLFHGTSDARGFNQWKAAGRKVKKGTHAFQILAPCFVKAKEEKPEKGIKAGDSLLVGFKCVNVHALEDTEVIDADLWNKSSGVDHAAESWLDNLPLREVAEAWGLKVESYNGENRGALGYYKHGRAIAIGTENLSTWAHELIHAADDRLDNIVKSGGQNPGNETVAEFGGAILLSILGMERQADLGGCLNYIRSYADDDKGKAISRAMKLIKRTCEAVALILDTAEEVKARPAAAAA